MGFIHETALYGLWHPARFCIETAKPSPSIAKRQQLSANEYNNLQLDNRTVLPYTLTMIIGKFRHKGLRALYESDDMRGVPAPFAGKIKRILAALEFADDLAQVATMPGWKLHPLKGERKGEYGITITGNWRLTFTLQGNSITDIDFEDYH